MNFQLRKYKKGDEKSLRKNINDKEIADNTLKIPYPYKKEDAEEWIERNIELEKEKEPEEVNFVIDIDGEVAGSVALMHIDRKHKNAEIGYWLGRKYWGKGIMTEAVRKMVEFGFEELGLKRIYAYIFQCNKASQKVLEKAGFQKEGKLRKSAFKNGEFRDSYLYAVIDEDLE